MTKTTRLLASFIALAALVACGADGAPIRPHMNTSINLGTGGVSTSTNIGLSTGPLSVGLNL